MLRSISISFALFWALLLTACDQAINDRYDGLEVVEVVEVIDTRDQEQETEEDLFDDGEEALTASNISRPVPRPAAMSLTGLSGAQADLEEPVLVVPNTEDTEIAGLGLPPARPQTVANTGGLTLDISALSQISPAAERPGDVSFTAAEDQSRLARMAEEEAEEAARIAAEAEAKEAARLAALTAAVEEARLAELATQEAEARAAQEAARQAELAAASIANAQPEAQGQPNTSSSIFAPVDFQGAPAALNAASQLNDAYGREGFDLSQIMAGTPVPNLIVQRMPEDMEALGEQDRALMKEVFIKTVLPLCLRSNSRIAAERTWYDSIPTQSRVGDLTASPSRIVRSLAVKYQASSDMELSRRLGPIPPSLCLAQAIHDSDWGRNASVQNQNGLFGSWARSTQDPAVMVPIRGRDGNDGQSTVFLSLERAVDTYALFLNRHDDLTAFRIRRSEELSIGQALNGRAGSVFMDQFRPLETAYRDRLLRLIDENDLDQFDLTRLAGTPTAIAVN